jgi:hypothetical protein
LIVGLSGYAQSGKDTVAQILVDNYGFKRLAFADKIRDMLYYLNPLVKEGFRVQGVVDGYGWEKAKVLFPEIRKELQELGVSARVHLGTDVWVHAVLNQMVGVGDYVITDVRFKNEATMIKEANGQIWRVTRPGVNAVNAHVSETELDDYPVDHFVKNDGDVKDLWEEVLMLCHHMGLDDDKFI